MNQAAIEKKFYVVQLARPPAVPYRKANRISDFADENIVVCKQGHGTQSAVEQGCTEAGYKLDINIELAILN